MRFRRKDEKNFIKVGLFLAALTGVLMIMIVSIGKENSFFNPKVTLRARVDNVKNLKPGSSVELKGIRVGSVDEINIIAEDMVEISFTILESELQWIKQDSSVAVSTAGLVGDKMLEIYGGTKSAPILKPETEFLKSENLSDLKQLMVKGESIATITERILSRLDQIIYNMDDGKKIIETVNSLNKTSLNMEKITSELREAHIGTTMANMNKASLSIARITDRIEKGPGTLNSMIYDDSLHEDLRALLGGASRNKVIKYFIRESIQDSERKKTKTN